MTEQELMQNRKQFGLIGASEAFTEDLINQMKAGVKNIDHPYAVKNKTTGDEANVTFRLVKSDRSDLYFLNSWDVTARKFGDQKEVSMTFYNNDLKRLGHILKNPEKHVTTFTLSRSINYLCGRPVLNTYQNLNSNIKKVWDQAFPGQTLPNGKMKERSFHPEYGFDLRTVGNEYRQSIKSLASAEYGERLYQSLERGNLEKTTFLEKNGKEVSYYVTPNISAGYFEVYTECHKDARPLTPEQQAEKGFISQEFAQKVRERLTVMEQQHVQKSGQSNGQNNKEQTPEKENRKQRERHKNKDDTKEQRPKRRQKLG